jgi:hypothetical protein
MAIDEQRFGELIGTVGALVVTVADLKGAILPALKEQRLEMAKYRDDCRDAMEVHKKDDNDIHEKIETLCKPIADLIDWRDGDGTPEDIGAKKQLNGLITTQIKNKAWAAGVAAVVSGIFILIGWAVEAFKR